MANLGYEHDSKVNSEDFVERLSPTAGMEELVRSFIRDTQQKLNRSDEAQMDFRKFLDSLPTANEKPEA